MSTHPDAMRLDQLTGEDAPENWRGRYEQSLMGVFGSPQDLLTTGSGCWVTDSTGRELLDMLGGIAVNALGHAHPRLVTSLHEQLSTLGHISNLFTSVPQMRLAEMLLNAAEAPEGSRVFFANSGSEANEAALKAVLGHGQAAGKPRILALEGGFHGRTVGALSVTHKPAFREPFGQLITGVEFLPPNDVQALDEAFGPDVAGIFIEPVQGESGVLPLQESYLQRVQQLSREYGALFVLDEVQTGMGRTANWFRYQGVNQCLQAAGDDDVVIPDLMTLAKGLGAGVPIGALVAFGEANGTLLGAGQHGSTFGGNPLAALAGQITMEVIQSDALLDNAHRIGEQLATGLEALSEVAEVRQYGLLLGIDLNPEAFPSSSTPARDLVTSARENHQMIINAPGDTTIRLAPPLILGADEADTFLTRFTAAVKELAS